VLALLHHVGADAAINALLTPVTYWWLGLPVVLGVPILFGVLRKELSLLMIYQALGTFEVGTRLDWVQITTFLLFLTFYIPCISTFAVMLKTIGRRRRWFRYRCRWAWRCCERGGAPAAGGVRLVRHDWDRLLPPIVPIL